MTVKEYNEIYYQKIVDVECFVQNLESAMSKTNDYENAMMQLRCIGWSNELKETIKLSLKEYRNKLYKEFE